MLKRVILTTAMLLTLASLSSAQTTGTPAKRTTPTPPPAGPEGLKSTPTNPQSSSAASKGSGTNAKNPAAMSLLDTFNALLDGIRGANAKVVSGYYWKSPELLIFNSNGTVTKGWEQMSKNRESSYAKLKDVLLETRDVHATMLGRDGGVVNFLWTQSQTSDGVPDTASGRTTLVFRRVGTSWKIIQAHISPDSPDPSRVLKSEQTESVPAPPPASKP